MKILVLCSGGDAPGMNRFLYTLSKKFAGEIYYAKAGFKGLVNGDIFAVDMEKLEKAKDEAGTIILSSRYPEFKEEKFFKKGVKNAKKFDFVVILGGNGSQNGARELFESGVKTIFVPATIDNDVEDSFYSIGFDTAVSQCVYVVENTMPSINSFLQTCLFEIMGNKSDMITKAVANIVHPDYCILNEKDLDYLKIGKCIKKNLKEDKGTMILVKEKIKNIFEIKKALAEKGFAVKSHIVGRLQRGGKPTKKELQMADKFATMASKLVKSNCGGKKVLVDINQNVFVTDF